MTEFTETLRHYCRNPRCRSKLPTAVSNPRESFCTKGCHSSFYRRRCLICEGAMKRRTENQLVCGKRRCRNALQARNGLGKYLPTSACVSSVENPIKIKMGIKSGDANDRAWRIVAAGSTPSSSAFHRATVGAKEAVEAINRTKARTNARRVLAASAGSRLGVEFSPENRKHHDFPAANVTAASVSNSSRSNRRVPHHRCS
jgi:hypothetical protein